MAGRGNIKRGRGGVGSQTRVNTRSGGNTNTANTNTAFVSGMSNNSVPCGLCKISVSDNAIGCDSCNKWYHPSSMCVGLPDDLVKSISDYGGDGISFICSECRLSGSGDKINNSSIKQLFETVKNLCQTVSILSADVKKLFDASVSNSRESGPPVSMRLAIQEEIREMDERSKRRDSIVIRGLEGSNDHEANEQFKPIVRHIIGRDIQLDNFTCINREKNLFRGKITSSDDRRELLENAKTLKNSRYSGIYINRDLTYNQRQELFSRRMERNRDNGIGNSSATVRQVRMGASSNFSNAVASGGPSSTAVGACPPLNI